MPDAADDLVEGAELQFRRCVDKQQGVVRAGNLVNSDRKLAVVGLGYDGLPVAAAFARAGYAVVAFDIDGNSSLSRHEPLTQRIVCRPLEPTKQ
jgi:UDP-glucose/GDP-mannose dehydrogenase family, NAD binding domain